MGACLGKDDEYQTQEDFSGGPSSGADKTSGVEKAIAAVRRSSLKPLDFNRLDENPAENAARGNDVSQSGVSRTLHLEEVSYRGVVMALRRLKENGLNKEQYRDAMSLSQEKQADLFEIYNTKGTASFKEALHAALDHRQAGHVRFSGDDEARVHTARENKEWRKQHGGSPPPSEPDEDGADDDEPHVQLKSDDEVKPHSATQNKEWRSGVRSSTPPPQEPIASSPEASVSKSEDTTSVSAHVGFDEPRVLPVDEDDVLAPAIDVHANTAEENKQWRSRVRSSTPTARAGRADSITMSAEAVQQIARVSRSGTQDFGVVKEQLQQAQQPETNTATVSDKPSTTSGGGGGKGKKKKGKRKKR